MCADAEFLQRLKKAYRYAQVQTVMLNDAFRSYLTCFLSVLFAIVGMLLFIREHQVLYKC
jgi:hypothetical protein